jgi:hypothetical protein
MGSCELIQDDRPRIHPDEAIQAETCSTSITRERLVLYKDEYIVKKIPASATDYLVNILTPGRYH